MVPRNPSGAFSRLRHLSREHSAPSPVFGRRALRSARRDVRGRATGSHRRRASLPRVVARASRLRTTLTPPSVTHVPRAASARTIARFR
jgi:hypothetical protein